MFTAFLDTINIKRATQVNHSVIDQYIEHMKSQNNVRFNKKGLADASIARRLAAVSSYLDYVRASTNPKLHNPLTDFTNRWRQNNLPKPVDDSTINSLLEGISNQRDRVLITLFLSTGLRVSEMHSLDRDTIAFELDGDAAGRKRLTGAGEVIGKGRKKRRFYVDEETIVLYAKYLSSREDHHPALFLSERRQRMSVGAIQYTLRTWCKKLGLPHINVHRLRHTFATTLA